MPIKPENRPLYPPDWKEISARIRKEAGQCCQFCGVANGALIERRAGKTTKIVLTVAHLDQDPRNCSDDNLRALCQKCHLDYDREWRRRNGFV
jgi:5-methylcytosine-specific restriction endonuclease McrA